jgi:hypothetical protein
MKSTYIVLALSLFSYTTSAQKTEKSGHSIAVTSDGIRYDKTGPDGKSVKEDKEFSISVGMVDIGINSLHDKTDYGATETKSFLQVPPASQNENLFSLRTAKSINVNIYPVMAKWRMLKSNTQRMFLSSGVGLQMYNFRFNKNISFVNQTVPMVTNDTVQFSKNKLGVTYLSIPLMLTFKTKMAEKSWLVYGVGASVGYRIDSWTKQVSKERGKEKLHDPFNLNDFNACVTAEVGLEYYFRLYASYQLTSLYETGLQQHPFSIGLKFGGI